MGNVTVTGVSKSKTESLSRGNGIRRKLVGVAVSHIACASLPHMFSVDVKSRRAAVLKARERVVFYFRLPHFIRVESQCKCQGTRRKSLSST